MWFGGKLFDNIKEFVTTENADILGLQEVYNSEEFPLGEDWHLVKSLAKILGYPYFAFAPAFGEVGKSGQRVQNGNAVLSKYPIQSSNAKFYDHPYRILFEVKEGDYRSTPRNIQHAEIILPDTTLQFFNTQGIWGFDGKDNERRLEMGDIIAKEVAGKKPALLMGDFNVCEGTKTINRVEAHMNNVFKGELTSSFNMLHKKDGGFATSVVDMMFASPDIKIGNHYASKANVSDHIALVSEFEI